MCSLSRRNYTVRARHKIEVREGNVVLKTICRVLVAEQIGNFSPIFARFQGNDHQVHSDEGDVSDPFRRKESYLTTLYIKAS